MLAYAAIPISNKGHILKGLFLPFFIFTVINPDPDDPRTILSTWHLSSVLVTKSNELQETYDNYSNNLCVIMINIHIIYV